MRRERAQGGDAQIGAGGVVLGDGGGEVESYAPAADGLSVVFRARQSGSKAELFRSQP